MKNMEGATSNFNSGDNRHAGVNYESTQVHVVDLSTTVSIFNRWNHHTSPDIGIGNRGGSNTD